MYYDNLYDLVRDFTSNHEELTIGDNLHWSLKQGSINKSEIERYNAELKNIVNVFPEKNLRLEKHSRVFISGIP